MLDALARACHEVGTSRSRAALPLLIRATGPSLDPDAVQLDVLDLEGRHPGSVLLGFTAPADCIAVGVVSTGWSLPPDRAAGDAANRRTGPPAAEAADRVAVFSTVVVGRDCEVAGRLVVGGADPVDGPPESGALLDLLLRSLGCPTAPPAVGVLELLATVWLVQLADGASARRDWAEVAGRHWALRLLADRGPDDLVAAAADVAGELGWAGIRRVVGRTGWPGVCTASEAAWFDDGAFARWLLGSFPPIADLAAAVSGRLRPSVARRVRAALASWGLAA